MKLPLNIICLMMVMFLTSCVNIGFTERTFDKTSVIMGVNEVIFTSDCLDEKCIDTYRDIITGKCNQDDRVQIEFGGYKNALFVCTGTAQDLKNLDPGPGSDIRIIKNSGTQSGKSYGVGI